MQLYRRWPGETSISPFVTFEFPAPLVGPFRISFVKEEHAFYMKDLGTSAKVRGIEAIEADYVPPWQSGMI
jgi:hypothetical protein